MDALGGNVRCGVVDDRVRTSQNSSADRRATRTFRTPLAARLAVARATEAFETSVATTLRKFGASATVKQPLPQ